MVGMSAQDPLELAVDDPRWVEFVAASPDAIPFHHPSWVNLLEEAYGYRPFALVLDGDSGALRAGLPVMEVEQRRGGRWIALPFTDRCAPLLAGASEQEFAESLERTRKLAGIGRFDVRAELPGAQFLRGSLGHVVPLEADPEEVFGRIRSRFRTMIRRLEREAVVTIERGERAAALTGVYYDLHLETRRRLGKPVQHRRFFELLWERALEPGLGFVLLAHAHGRPVAGAVFLAWNGTVIYLYGASNEEARSLHANELLFWRAIEWACRDGHESFDLGRTNPENNGLRQFKTGWGATETPLVYTALADEPVEEHGDGRAQRFAETLIRRAPPGVSRRIGELLNPRTA
jgi:hypothetical protein